MRADEANLLQRLPEVPVPEALDTLVFERGLEALEAAPEPPAPVHLPRAEALVYAAGLTAYLADLVRSLHSVAQHTIRLLGG
jgi:hypothetical protein